MIDYLLKYHNFLVTSALGIQLPVIILLFLLTIEVTKFDKSKYTYLLAYGWLINLFIVIIKYFDLTNRSNIYLDFTSDVLNLIMSFIFLIIGLISFNFHRHINLRFRVPYKLFYFSIFTIFIFIFYLNFNSNNNYFTLFSDLLNAISLFTLLSYYHKQSNSIRFRMFIKLGLGFYIFLQFIDLFPNTIFGDVSEKNHYKLLDIFGWTSSGITKIILLFGLYKLIISKTHETLKIDIYENIFNLALHESVTQIQYSHIKIDDELIPNFDKVKNEGKLSKSEMVESLKDISYTIKRIEYIHDATVELMKLAKGIENINEMQLNPMDKLMDLSFNNKDSIATDNININRVLEYCYLWRKKNQDISSYSLKAQYGGRCFVRFNEEILQQIIINILKNAEDSYAKINEKDYVRIYIKTSIDKHFDKGQESESNDFDSINNIKYIKIEIEDDGIGTDLAFEEIIKHGVSEKGTKYNKGIGMWFIHKYIHMFEGILEFESPPKKSLISFGKKINRGAKVILYIPYSED